MPADVAFSWKRSTKLLGLCMKTKWSPKSRIREETIWSESTIVLGGTWQTQNTCVAGHCREPPCIVVGPAIRWTSSVLSNLKLSSCEGWIILCASSHSSPLTFVVTLDKGLNWIEVHMPRFDKGLHVLARTKFQETICCNLLVLSWRHLSSLYRKKADERRTLKRHFSKIDWFAYSL